jgi:hypothetical protein
MEFMLALKRSSIASDLGIDLQKKEILVWRAPFGYVTVHFSVLYLTVTDAMKGSRWTVGN